MEKILITGFSGFVGKHLIEFFQDCGKIEVFGIDIKKPDFSINDKSIKIRFKKINLLNKKKLTNILIKYKPSFIIHLASFSSVSDSWKNPYNCFQNNIMIFLNLLEIIRKNNIKTRILSVGSSEEYGKVEKTDLPLKETMHYNPISPYAIARVSQEMLSKIYANSYGLDIVMTRSFNHIGPGQTEKFVVPALIKQLIKISKLEHKHGKIIAGDLSIIRDFIDVRDVTKAYYMLLKKGRSGEVYNICSGTGIQLKEIVNICEDLLKIKVDCEIDEKLLRPQENKVVIGDNSKIRSDIGWEPSIGLVKSISDLIEFWRKKDEKNIL